MRVCGRCVRGPERVLSVSVFGVCVCVCVCACVCVHACMSHIHRSVCDTCVCVCVGVCLHVRVCTRERTRMLSGKEGGKPEKSEAGRFDSLVRERPLLEKKKVRERSLLRTQWIVCVWVCVCARARARKI